MAERQVLWESEGTVVSNANHIGTEIRNSASWPSVRREMGSRRRLSTCG